MAAGDIPLGAQSSTYYYVEGTIRHTPVVQTFRIIPHRKGGYRIEAVAKYGGTEVIETHQTERAALVRLKILQEKAERAWGRFATRQGCG